MKELVLLPLLLFLQGPGPAIEQAPSRESPTEQSQQDQGSANNAVSPLNAQNPSLETQESPEQNPADELSNTYNRVALWSTIIQAATATAIAIFTFLLVRYNRGLLLATKQAAEAARINALVLRKGQCAQLTVGASNPIRQFYERDHPPRIEFTLANKGLTPARDCRVETWIEILPYPFDDFTDSAVHYTFVSPMTIYPNAPTETVLDMIPGKPDEAQLADLESGKKIVCFRVRIAYRDLIDDRRVCNFGFWFAPGGLAFLPKYNDSN